MPPEMKVIHIPSKPSFGLPQNLSLEGPPLSHDSYFFHILDVGNRGRLWLLCSTHKLSRDSWLAIFGNSVGFYGDVTCQGSQTEDKAEVETNLQLEIPPIISPFRTYPSDPRFAAVPWS